MSHYSANVRDLEFNLFEVLDLGTLLDQGVYGDLDSETAKAMLHEVAHFSQEVVAESFVEADRNPVQFILAEYTITVPDALRKTVAAVHTAGSSALAIPQHIGA